MAGRKPDIAPDDDAPMVDDYEPGSGKRVKRRGTPTVQELFDEFAEHARGLGGADFEREFDLLVDRIVERNLGIAPPAMRDALRETIKSYLENDPTLSSMVAELRAASR